MNTHPSKPPPWAASLGAFLICLATTCICLDAAATPLYTARAGRTCNNCHTLPNDWYDPPDVSKRKCTLSCASCHVDPNGGGLRNVSGRYFAESTLPLFNLEERPIQGEEQNVNALWTWLNTKLPSKKRSNKPAEPGSEPTSGPIRPADRQLDPRPPGSPEPNDGPVLGRPVLHGSSEMAWLDGRYANMNADPLLTVGGDARLGFWNQGPLLFPMQLDLYTALHPIEHFTVAANVGARGRKEGFNDTIDRQTGTDAPILVKDLWFMTHEWPYLSHARFGRFVPAFGWRIDDHTAYTRRPFGLSQEYTESRVVGTEIGFTGNYLYGNMSLFKPSQGTGQNPFATQDGWGGSAHAGWSGLGWGVGASAMMRNRPFEHGGDTLDLSLQWSLNPWYYVPNLPITYLGEVVAGTLQRPLSGSETTQTAAMHQLSWMVYEGVTIHGRYDFWDPDREVINDSIHRPGVGLEFVPITGFTVRGDVRVGLPEGPATSPGADLFVQLHGWF